MKYIRIICLMLVVTIIYLTYSNNIFKSTITNKEKYDNNNISILEKYGYIPGYSCKNIRVVNEDGEYEGTYNLEDYVAGVVVGETHILDDEVTFEAMAVAIRTYALYVTNNCRGSIRNGESNQVMSNPNLATPKIKRAVAKTKGQVLTLNGKLVKSEYDSFYMGDGFYCDKKFCYSNYRRAGNAYTKPKTHKVKVPATWLNDLSGGHGNGMSQYGAKYLSQEGYTYEQILKYFYADGVQISTTIKPNVDGLVLDNNFASRTSRPQRNNKFYYKNNEVPDNTLEGDSTWYATSRANEILSSVNSNKNLSYMDSVGYCNVNNFVVSYDYKTPKVGSIISWDNHLGIIEKVDGDTVDISEAYIGLGYYGIEFSNEYLTVDGKFYNDKTNKKDRKYNCEQNKSGCFKRTNNIKIEDLKNRWGYDFKCYVYLID